MTPPTTWWDDNGAVKRRTLILLLRLWPRRRQPQAEPALRIPLPAFRPAETGAIPCDVGLPSAVSSLPLVPVDVPEFVTSVVFDAAAGASPNPRGVSPGPSRTSAPVRGSPRPSYPAANDSFVARLRLVLAPPLESLLPGPASVLQWPGELMPFQTDGVRALIGSEKLLLADDMGLGKTIQAIAALRILRVQRKIESALVVAPASLLDQWRQELYKWAPELRIMTIRGSPVDRSWQWVAEVHVALVSFETLRSDFSDNLQSPLRRKTWDVLVADEAQRIKNRNATSSAVKGVKRHRSWALTGTPLENNEEELASIVEFVDHSGLVSQNHYFAGPKLRELHRELQLRRKKGEVLKDLPPKSTIKLSIPLLPQQRRSYDRAEREGIVHLRELGADVRVQHVLELIARLKQICNADPESGQSAKFEDIHQRIETLAGQDNRALVFSQYTSDGFGVGAISGVLSEFDPLTFTGAHTLEERRDTIRRFRTNGKHKVLIVSLRAGGVGLNLQEASYVFHLDRWWNPAVERQAEDRSHRYGQTVPVHVFKYSCIDTIEERIDQIMEQKQALFDELVDDVSIDLAASLSADQLFGLFGMENPSGRGSR